MFSDRTYAEIQRLTKQALQEMTGSHALDRVAMIRGYAQIASGGPVHPEFERKLLIAVHALAHFAGQHQKPDLARALAGLVARMEKEC
jgi:hypothetical protein